MIALCGVSGSGKSTLLKCITGEVVPTAGTVRLGDDARSYSVRPCFVDVYVLKRLEADLVRATSLSRAVGGLASEGGGGGGGGGGVEELVALLGESEGSAPYASLSEAAQMRAKLCLAIAEALASTDNGGGRGAHGAGSGGGSSAGAGGVVGEVRPIVLLDELLDGTGPSSFATPQLQSESHAFLQSAAARLGGAVLYATHSDRHAALADDVVWMSSGKVRQVAPPSGSSWLEWRRGKAG